MEKELIIKKRAFNSIQKISKIIFFQGYPDRAIKFSKELFEFAKRLTNTADSFSLCRHNVFSKKGFKCIPYKKNYIFIVSVLKNKIIIHNIIDASKIR